jgi:hypothetical protein
MSVNYAGRWTAAIWGNARGKGESRAEGTYMDILSPGFVTRRGTVTETTRQHEATVRTKQGREAT